MALPYGLFLLPSYFNHSCDENAIHICFGDVIAFFARKDIAAGEEIFVTYYNQVPDYHGRQNTFRVFWGFNCRCSWCQEEAKDSRNKWLAEHRVSVLLQLQQVPSTGAVPVYMRALERVKKRYGGRLPTNGLIGSYWISLGHSRLRDGDLKGAARAYKTGLTCRAHWEIEADNLGYLAQVYEIMGKKEKSFEKVKELVKFVHAVTRWDVDVIAYAFWQKSPLRQLTRSQKEELTKYLSE
jgi:hypothetical protein